MLGSRTACILPGRPIDVVAERDDPRFCCAWGLKIPVDTDPQHQHPLSLPVTGRRYVGETELYWVESSRVRHDPEPMSPEEREK